jgi:hypothetical protein
MVWVFGECSLGLAKEEGTECTECTEREDGGLEAENGWIVSGGGGIDSVAAAAVVTPPDARRRICCAVDPGTSSHPPSLASPELFENGVSDNPRKSGCASVFPPPPPPLA